MDKKNKILLFGGTFNPIHNGHLLMAQEAVERLSFNEVIFIPSAIPPYKKDVLSFVHRLKMTQLATNGIDYFTISDIESKREGPSYTIDTVRHFQEKLGEDTQIYWLIGTDTVKDIKKWYKPRELLKECKFVLAERNPYEHYGQNKDYFSFLKEEIGNLIETPLVNYFIPLINSVLEISSTDIRSRIRTNEKYATKFLIPEKVEQYINDNQLYKNQ